MAVGSLADRRIAPEYLRNVARASFFPSSADQKDFSDISVGIGNSQLYSLYLLTHHPKLSAADLVDLSSNGLQKIPDLMTFDPPRRTEFYEVKPNNSDGMRDGLKKISQVHALCQAHSLPYTPGIQWQPDTKIRLFSGSLMGLVVDVDFHFKWVLPGLIVYDFCASGKTRPLTNAEIAVIVAAVLITLITGPVSVLVPKPI